MSDPCHDYEHLNPDGPWIPYSPSEVAARRAARMPCDAAHSPLLAARPGATAPVLSIPTPAVPLLSRIGDAVRGAAPASVVLPYAITGSGVGLAIGGGVVYAMRPYSNVTTPYGVVPGTVNVPEPSSIALLCIGVLCVLITRRRHCAT